MGWSRDHFLIILLIQSTNTLTFSLANIDSHLPSVKPTLQLTKTIRGRAKELFATCLYTDGLYKDFKLVDCG